MAPTASNDGCPSAPVPSPTPALPWERLPAVVSRPSDTHPSDTVELTRSDRQFIAAYCEGGGLAEVGRRWALLRGSRPYKTSDAAANSASRKFVELKRRLAASGNSELLYEWMGLTGERIVKALTDAFEADRYEPVMVRRDSVVTLENGEQKVVRQDQVQVVRVAADHRTRVEAASKAAALRGELYANRKNQVDVTNKDVVAPPQIIVNIRRFSKEVPGEKRQVINTPPDI